MGIREMIEWRLSENVRTDGGEVRMVMVMIVSETLEMDKIEVGDLL